MAQQFDLEVFRQHNELRTNPQSFIPDLEEMIPRFNGKMYTRPNDPVLLQTNEGSAAVQELIDYLKTAVPIDALEWDEGMMKAAKDHITNMAEQGATGHTGLDNSSPFQRMERYTKLEGSSGENISYGMEDPKLVLIQLAIDDGVQGRGHRLNLMNPAFVKVGCYTGDHGKYKKSTVLCYNGSFAKQGGGSAGPPSTGNFDMQGFMGEVVQWDEPENHMGFSESTKASMGGGKATKVVTRTYKMGDGTTKVEEKTITKIL